MAIRVSRWGVLAIICLYVFIVYVAFHTLTPILSLLFDDLNITHAESGLLVAAFPLPTMIGIIPLSFFAPRIGLKRIGIVSLALMILGSLIMVLARSFLLLFLGRLIIGIGALGVPFVGLQGVAQWFRDSHLGLAMGIYSTAMIAATIFALNLFGPVALEYGWRGGIWISLLMIAITLVAFIFVFKSAPEDTELREKQNSISYKRLKEIGTPLWMLGIFWGVVNIGMISLVVFSPDFLYSSGFELGIAGTVTSIIIIVNTVLSPLAGFVVDRIKYKELLNIVGAIFTALFVFLLPLNVNMVVWYMWIIGLFTTPYAAVTYAIVPSIVKSHMLSLAYAVIAMFANLGLFLGPYFTGLIRDVTGAYLYSYWFTAGIFLLSALVTGVAMIYRLKKDAKMDVIKS